MSALMTTKMLPRRTPNLSKQWPVSRKTRKFTKEAQNEEQLFDQSFGCFETWLNWSVRTRPPAQGRPGSVMYQILDQYRNISNIFLTGLSDTTRTQPKRQSIDALCYYHARVHRVHGVHAQVHRVHAWVHQTRMQDCSCSCRLKHALTDK